MQEKLNNNEKKNLHVKDKKQIPNYISIIILKLLILNLMHKLL